MGHVTGFANFPDCIAQLCQAQQDPRHEGKDGYILEGQRNDSLFKLAAAMRRYGCNQGTIEAALLSDNAQRCDPPLLNDEVKNIAASASRYKPIRPNSDPMSTGLDESNAMFCPIDILDLLNAPHEEIPWLIPGYAAPGRWSLIAGPPKIGKTTWAYEAMVNVARGGFWLGRMIRRGNVLVLAVEEHRDDVARRFRSLGTAGLDGNIKIITGPLEFSSRMIREIIEYVNGQDIALVVVDTLPAWWHLENENDASEVLKSGRMLLNAIRQTNAALVCLVHTRKSGGEAGSEIRGSSALVGLVDIAISMKHPLGDERIRVLETVSRFSQTPRELVIRYGEKGYESMGSPAQVSAFGKAEQVLAVLGDIPRTSYEISKEIGFSKQEVSRALDLINEQVESSGSGHKGDPYRYRRRSNSMRPGSNTKGERLDESQSVDEEIIVVD